MESNVILLKSLFLASFVLVLASCELNETESCSAGEARLVDGTSDNDGVLEICKDDESSWGTVCNRYLIVMKQKLAVDSLDTIMYSHTIQIPLGLQKGLRLEEVTLVLDQKMLLLIAHNIQIMNII